MKKRMSSIGFLCSVVTFFLIITMIGIAGDFTGDIEVEAAPVIVEEPINTESIKIDDEMTQEDEAPEAINGLFIGFDKSGGLTDVIMVGHIDPIDNKVQIISVPRDLEIDFTDEAFKHIKEGNPKNRILHCKLNNIYSLIGWDERALEDVKSVIEVITGLEIDYMMTIDISGFSNMVDAVGGVEFYVPQRMYYVDRFQDLYIDLQEGLQVLDGDKAEQLVRYRKGYAMGDLQRIKVQQNFLSTLVNQVLHSGSFSQISSFLKEGYDLIETDFGVIVMLEYAEFFFDLDLDNILSGNNMMTIPSYGEKKDDVWFQYFDLEKGRAEVKALLENE